jgi:hypothetical protein
VAQLRRAAETAGFRQANEIFKPFGFHKRDYERARCKTKGLLRILRVNQSAIQLIAAPAIFYWSTS